ncbi:hypothetical protein E2320_005625 [Naja naja]|nr:hypothetical protein E2320_005625 [Naja naja]
MLQSSAHFTGKEALRSELKVLSYQYCPILVTPEYCCYGDLWNFLRRKRDSFICQGPEETAVCQNILYQKEHMYDATNDNMDMEPGVSQAIHAKTTKRLRSLANQDVTAAILGDDEVAPDVEDLLSFSYQVAKSFFFHLKIAFTETWQQGIDITNDLHYVVEGNARLPVKWMASENISLKVCTPLRAMFGLMEFCFGNSSLWEAVPYPRECLGIPKIFNIGKSCWDSDPGKRPTLKQTVQLIQQQISGTTSHVYSNVSNAAGSSASSTQPLLTHEGV